MEQERGRVLCLALLLCMAMACTTTPYDPGQNGDRALEPWSPVPELEPTPIDPAELKIQPEADTVEQNWALDLYAFFHDDEFRSFRLIFPGADGEEIVGHLLIPDAPGPHPLVVTFPILEGSHVVSEAVAKALVDRDYAVLRMERRDLDLTETRDPDAPAENFRNAIRDARGLLTWVLQNPRLDPERVASAGVSTGGVLALTLLQVDPRVRGGFYMMVGGNLPEVLYDSSEKPIRVFRDRLAAGEGLETRDAWVDFVRPYLVTVDPITYAKRVDPTDILLISGRFDRVMRPAYTRQLWEALGRPTWKKFPAGHYQLAPFFFWAVGKGADHLDALFEQNPDGR